MTDTNTLAPAENIKADLSQEKNETDTIYLEAIKSRENGDFRPLQGTHKPYTGRTYNGNIAFITGSVEDAKSIEAKTDSFTGAIALDTFTGADMTLATTLAEWNGPDAQDGTGTAIICLDNTDQGRKKAADLLQAVQDLRIKAITYNICGTYKTPTEAATADPEQFTQAVQDAQEKAKAAHLPDSLDNFLAQIQTDAYKPSTTGLDFLDELLTGGLIKQTLALLMAAPGTGKTTLAQQAAEAIAKNGTPVIFLNLEMSEQQMLAKAISSRLAQQGIYTLDSNGNPADYDTLKILQGYTWTATERAAITAELDAYRHSIYKRLRYNPNNIGSDLDRITEYLTKTGENAKAAGTQAPVVILDYLHLVTTGRGLDAQELIKQTTTALKDYAIKYDTTALAIVAVNRKSMTEGQLSINSGRDSSAIEYTADYIITLNYYDFDQGKKDPQKDSDLAALQKERYRRMILRLPKSRYGQPGRYSKIYYNAAANYFLSGDFIPDGAKDFDSPEE